MFKNYFKTAWRNITRNRFHSSLNIFGLAVGVAFALLVGAYIWDCLGVNKNLKNIDRQYIIQSSWGQSGTYDLTTVGNLAKALRERYPGLVANYYRWDGITGNVSKGDKHFRENIQINDSTFFEMYGFPVLYGNPETALKEPFTAVITEPIAKKYFGKTNVVGQTLTIENFSGAKHDFMVTAVLKNMPLNSITSINSNNLNDIFLPASNDSYFGRQIDSWQNPWIVGCVELQKGISPAELEKPMTDLVKNNTPFGISDQMHPLLVSLNRYYLDANNALVKRTLYTLSFIAAFILLMAVINFINISISKASSRMKEIGVRKVLGGMRRELIQQFLFESLLIAVFSTMIALAIYEVARPYMNAILGADITSLFNFPAYIYAVPFMFVLFIGLLAGIYPALILSSLKSSEVIKGKLSSVGDNILLRKLLVGLQFCIAAIVLTGSIIISQQINYFFGKDIGYDKDYVVTVPVPRDWTPKGRVHMETIRNEFASVPQVQNVTMSYEIPDGNNGDASLTYKLGEDSSKAISTDVLTVDDKYAETYKIPLISGTFFNKDGSFDSSKIVINQTFARLMGWKNPNEAINQPVRITYFGNRIFTIAGVTKDFHFGSMQDNIPLITFINIRFTNQYRYLSLRVKPGNMRETISALQKKWTALLPDAPFAYQFMDDNLKRLYTTELQFRRASFLSVLLSVTIALLGVVGLVSLSIQKRTKEIGIRKVLGSSVAGIIILFIKEFLFMILIGGIIACPLAFIIMNNWLQNYTYRVDITASPFIVSVVCLGLITALLICAQTVKTAMSNPVESLRIE